MNMWLQPEAVFGLWSLKYLLTGSLVCWYLNHVTCIDKLETWYVTCAEFSVCEGKEGMFNIIYEYGFANTLIMKNEL